MEQKAKTGALRALNNSIAYMRKKIDPDMPATSMEVLMIIARNPDIAMVEILRRLEDVSMSAVSRHVSMLTSWTWNKRQGPGLVEWREDPYERRRKLCKLTPQGEKFVAELLEVFNSPKQPTDAA